MLGWEPTVSFDELVEMMVDADVARHTARLRNDREATVASQA